MAKLAMVEAVSLALNYELEHDKDVVVLGEDVGINGGVFRATSGLAQRFGEDRVIDTPLAEAMIAGMTVGMATQGMKPVAEAQFMGFIFPMFEQIVCHAARMRNRTRGRLSCPLVIRAPFGGGIHAPEHHSESIESMFAHTPGIRVVIPSSPSRAYGLLLAAIRDPDPVLFLEPKRIYRLVKEEVVDDGEELPLDMCFELREGNDITLVTWGSMIKETLEAAEALEKQGISAEVIDVATVSPIDHETIADSVKKTGRCVIIQEAPKHCGVASEIAATLAENSLYSLMAPIKRVAGYDVIMPLFKLEKKYMPTVNRILKAVNEVMEVS